jgi:RHH-type proline utilization regulon transcriptional repressor/proline dehydrogenase/delta 1-pyrroline-5-carboxylate dehydrogenase
MRPGELPPFLAAYAPADAALAARLLGEAARPAAAEARIDARAKRYVEAIRARAGGVGGIEDFLQGARPHGAGRGVAARAG